jgi:RNA polymerase sigma-70 factor (ECF subfamily)
VRSPQTEIERCFRQEYGRCVATLIRVLGDIGLAEEAVQEAFVVALAKWPMDGIPPNPGAWITTTARNRAIDRLRKESTRADHHAESALLRGNHESSDVIGPMRDDQLRLIFTCCHPDLPRNGQVALTLKLLGGLTVLEVAHAFLVPEATMAQRLVRAKRKIKNEGIPYRVPTGAELPNRLTPVMAVIYLIFNEGYVASTGDALHREDLCVEAIRLTRVLVDLMPDEAEVFGLLALLLLTHSRRSARTGPGGTLVLLPAQDRSQWNVSEIEEGKDLIRRCLARNSPGPYQIQAAINAVHVDAPTAGATDWRQILALYDQLIVHLPTPVVALNRAVALSEVAGPEAGLRVIERLELENYYLFHAARADLLRRLGRLDQAVVAYDLAISQTTNESEREFLLLQRQRVQVS